MSIDSPDRSMSVADRQAYRSRLRRAVDRLEECGTARLPLPDAAQDVLSANVRQGVLALQDLAAFSSDYHRPGDEHGLASGFHYFPTNDPGGRPTARDGDAGGLQFSRTWDLRGKSNPEWPALARPQSMLAAVRDLFLDLARDLATELLAHSTTERAYMAARLLDAAHDGTLLRTIISPGSVTADIPREKRTRHIWHTDATLFTILSLRDYAHPEPDVSQYDRLVAETREGGIETIQPTPEDVLIFAGRHLSAALDTKPVYPLRHAVVSEGLAPRIVTMLRIGFNPESTSLRHSSGRPLMARDGADVSSGNTFYGHLAARQGSPFFLGDGPVRRTFVHRGIVEGYA